MRSGLVLALSAAALLLPGCKKDPETLAQQGVESIGRGAVAYYQSEHPIDREPWVATAQYPPSDGEICAIMPREAGVWKDLGFSSDAESIEWCYFSSGNRFVATATTDLTTYCISGGPDGTLSEVKDGDCDLY